MVSEQEFINYATSILQEEDKEMFGKKKKANLIKFAIIIPLEIIIFSILILTSSNPGLFVALLILTLAATLMFQFQNSKQDLKNLKSKYISSLFDFLLKGYKYIYDSTSFIDKSVFKASGFAKDYTNYTGEDLLCINIPNDDGTPSSVDFRVSDLHITYEEKQVVRKTNLNGKSYSTIETSVRSVYDGIFAYIKFPFKFKCDLALNVDPFYQDKIKLEDIEFNKMFKTYTNNQMEALCILTPTMINKLKNFKNRSGNFALILDKENLYLKMERNIFELDSKSKNLNGEIFKNLYHDIFDFISIVEEIKNNNKIFKM